MPGETPKGINPVAPEDLTLAFPSARRSFSLAAGLLSAVLLAGCVEQERPSKPRLDPKYAGPIQVGCGGLCGSRVAKYQASLKKSCAPACCMPGPWGAMPAGQCSGGK